MTTGYAADAIDEAIHNTVHNYTDPDTQDKGLAAFARRTKRNVATLYKKVDPYTDTHLININELRLIMFETKNYSILEALAAECGYGAHPLPRTEVSEQKRGILDCVLNAAAEGGEACQVISESLADGKITAKESEKCSSEINDQINALIGLREKIIDSVVEPKYLHNHVSQYKKTNG